ncbi:MAG: hypothetical protein MAG715_01229 [Methanonatronarchaeales archaeon]|nr:hypothetical protein [Methanonatronarchaeales archaeon]
MPGVASSLLHIIVIGLSTASLYYWVKIYLRVGSASVHLALTSLFLTVAVVLHAAEAVNVYVSAASESVFLVAIIATLTTWLSASFEISAGRL